MRTLVVYCHPNPDSFGAAMRDRTLAGLRKAGHDVRLTDLYADGFEPELTVDEIERHHEPGVAPGLESYADDLRWAEAIVFVYPTWWSGQPAMLKGWMDRVWASGVAWELPEGSNVVRPLLRDIRRLMIVTSHGSSKWINVLEGESGKRTIIRSLRAMCSRRVRTKWVALYGIDTCGPVKRADFLDRVEIAASKLR
ncbi:MAG: NAD(P)H-dependent oxidoreductase [Ilumatobacter fluminis]|uniref:Putative NADPH-quinone reductase n=1 Tax=Ilumatobacter fluminis TaxID=467091 RepID=A0A4R7I2T5_9ACTN|nr:NAD(P)H-dependent oxidoreductase [Ilumatobacter fluminis]TDT17484.1 putative NADPH-quinone reductase [Ilumatobacter fluminis]